jgi:hypothetical protein
MDNKPLSLQQTSSCHKRFLTQRHEGAKVAKNYFVGLTVEFCHLDSNPHFSPGSREQAQDSCSEAPRWSEKRSHSYGLSEEQAYGHEDQPEP